MRSIFDFSCEFDKGSSAVIILNLSDNKRYLVIEELSNDGEINIVFSAFRKKKCEMNELNKSDDKMTLLPGEVIYGETTYSHESTNELIKKCFKNFIDEECSEYISWVSLNSFTIPSRQGADLKKCIEEDKEKDIAYDSINYYTKDKSHDCYDDSTWIKKILFSNGLSNYYKEKNVNFFSEDIGFFNHYDRRNWHDFFFQKPSEEVSSLFLSIIKKEEIDFNVFKNNFSLINQPLTMGIYYRILNKIKDVFGCIKEEEKEIADNLNFTPLMMATKAGNKKLVLQLLHSNASINKTVDGKTAMDIAIEQGHEELIEIYYAFDGKHSLPIKKDNSEHLEQSGKSFCNLL